MSFVSIEFFALFAFVLLLLATQRNNLLFQKIIILFASCVFYAYWDWRFLGLLIFVTFLDYYISIQIYRTEDRRAKRNWLLVSIVANLAILGYFKYFNFFIGTLNIVLHALGIRLPELSIILPIGISFYIFETLSYVIDVYRGTVSPARSLLDYAVFITFFPRLVAGPIMRASQFLPQLYRGVRLSQENFFMGAQLFAQGLIKKVVVADSVAYLVDTVYKTPTLFSSATVYSAVLAYSIQIYFDFSGYSDMACGIAKILGFDLPSNFNLPYISQSITEFWQRWHISLSTWFRDYVFFPLERRRLPVIGQYFNILVVFLLTGLWHGASWNFVFWGGLYGVYLIIERIFRTSPGQNKPAFRWSSYIKTILIFFLVSFTWIFFRSPSNETTLLMMEKILFITPGGVNWWYVPAILYTAAVVIGGLVLSRMNFSFQQISSIPKPFALAFLVFEYVFVLLFFSNNLSPFIYFQF